MSLPSTRKNNKYPLSLREAKRRSNLFANEIATLIPFARNDTDSALYTFHYLSMRGDVSIVVLHDISIVV